MLDFPVRPDIVQISTDGEKQMTVETFINLVCLKMKSKDSLVQWYAKQGYCKGYTVDKTVAQIKKETVE